MIPTIKRKRTEEINLVPVTSQLTTQSSSTPIISSEGTKKSAIVRPYEGKRIARVSVHKFFYTEEKEEERDLFLQAMNTFLNNPDRNDPWSYYAIAGIHGLPYVPYDSAVPPGGNKGYCEHGTVLFPTWHRPYILLFEQAIIRAAKTFAGSLSQEVDKEKYSRLADSLRMPYWDWESSFTAYQGLPDIFTSEIVHVKYPTQDIIPNPLRAYVLPVPLGEAISASDSFNPTAKPHYRPPTKRPPFTPAYYPTVRHPDMKYQSSTDTLNLSVQRNCNLVLRPQLYAALLQTDWVKFSNHSSNNGSDYGHFSSLEVVHDVVHDAIGGTGGHMSYPDIAAFDPIFWFHHCNVDRLLALWQYANPSSYVPDQNPAKPQDKNKKSALIPFWSYKSTETDTNQYLTSEDVQSINNWNYTYHTIEKAEKFNWSPEEMKWYIMTTFHADNHYGVRWHLNISKLPKRLDIGPYEVRVFIDFPEANIDTPKTNVHYAGAVYVFARSSLANCATCETVPYVRGSVDLTATMKQLGIAVDTELNPDDTQAIPFNKGFGNFTLVYATAAGEEIELNKIVGKINGKQTTVPILSLSWFKIFDGEIIFRGEMKPEQMEELFKKYRSTSAYGVKSFNAPQYQGKVVLQQQE